MANLIRFGLPPALAVAAATTAAHAFLGTAPLRPGEPARLVTFDADPIADPAVLARPTAVISGRSDP